MPEIELCASCGVPRFFGNVLDYLGNGVAACPFLPGKRGIVYEPAAINNLFGALEELLGFSIEHILVESARRDYRRFLEGVMKAHTPGAPLEYPEQKDARDASRDEAAEQELREKRRQYNLQAFTIGTTFGYGAFRLDENQYYEGRYSGNIRIVRNLYSLPLYAAIALATSEVFEKQDLWWKCEKIGEDTYRVYVYPGEHPGGLEDRLRVRGYDYEYKPGDIDFERCPECRLPLDYKSYEWNLEEGTITDPESGVRVVITSPSSLDAILADLEAELGEDIPRTVIEAQRRTMKPLLRERDWVGNGLALRRMIALRGLGNLTYYKGSERSLSIVIENSCMPLLMVGFAQALAELDFGAESSTYTYTLSEDGDLRILVET